MELYQLGRAMVLVMLYRKKHMRRATEGLSLMPMQMPLIEALIQNPNVTQQELADLLHVTPASVALSTKRLQKAGLLEKREDPDNRRRNRLCATDAAIREYELHRKARLAVDELTFRGFDESEKAELARFLARITENLADGIEPPCLFIEPIERKDT